MLNILPILEAATCVDVIVSSIKQSRCHTFMFSLVLCCLFLSFVWYIALSSCIVICCKYLLYVMAFVVNAITDY